MFVFWGGVPLISGIAQSKPSTWKHIYNKSLNLSVREVVFVKDSILGNWPKYERRRHEKNRARSASASAEGARVRRRRKASAASLSPEAQEIPRSGIESLLLWPKFLSLSSHVTCQNWIRPFTKKHRFIAQIDSARGSTASTAWRPCGLGPGIGYRVPENVL